MKRCLVVLLIGIVLFVSGLLALQDEREVTLRLKFQHNQLLTYEQKIKGEMTMTTQLPPPVEREMTFTMAMEGTMTQTERTEKVDEEGVATVLVTTKGKMQMEVTGLPAKAPVPKEQEIPPMRYRMKVDPRGKVLQFQFLDEDKQPPIAGKPFPMPFRFESPTGFNWQNLLFPEKPVKVGDNWDISQSIGFTVQDRSVRMEIKGQARLLEFEKSGERECAVIETTAEFPDMGEFISQIGGVAMPQGGEVQADGEAKNAGKIWFDFSAGKLVRSEEDTDLTINMTITMPIGQTLNFLIKGEFRTEQRLIKVGKAKPE